MPTDKSDTTKFQSQMNLSQIVITAPELLQPLWLYNLECICDYIYFCCCLFCSYNTTYYVNNILSGVILSYNSWNLLNKPLNRTFRWLSDVAKQYMFNLGVTGLWNMWCNFENAFISLFKSPVSLFFFLWWAAWTLYISSWVTTTGCQLYSNISQILLLYKTWGYCNKFDTTKLLGVCYWCVKIPQCRYMKHGLKHIKIYVQKHIAPLAMCYNPPLVCDKPLGAPASVKLVYWLVSSDLPMMKP